MSTVTTIIGIDCACNPRNVGLALGEYSNGRTAITDLRLGSRLKTPAIIASKWIREAEGPVLIALDAPLGWPAPLAVSLMDHKAGEPIPVDAHNLFRRATDRFVRQRIGKQPLDVGADRIARTAHAAVELLSEISAMIDYPILLAWERDFRPVSAIEVYPSATLTAHRINARGYKSARDEDARKYLVDALRRHVDIENPQQMIASADVIDAAVCVIAAADFLDGKAVPPQDQSLAQKEGWIWVADPSPL